MKAIKEELIVAIATRAAKDAFQTLISTTDISRTDALAISKDSANEFARVMVMMLAEHDFAVVPKRAA